MARHWLKLYITPGRRVAALLPDSELAALIRMALHTRYRDTTVRGTDGAPLDTDGIAALIGKSPRQTRRILTALQRRGLIHACRDGRAVTYRISEAIAYRGRGGERDGGTDTP